MNALAIPIFLAQMPALRGVGVETHPLVAVGFLQPLLPASTVDDLTDSPSNAYLRHGRMS